MADVTIRGLGNKGGEVIERVTVAEVAHHSERFPEFRYADVVMTLADGRLLESGDVHARGGPESPLNQSEVIDKYMEFAKPSLGQERAGKIRDAVLALVEPDTRYADLAALIFEAPAGSA